MMEKRGGLIAPHTLEFAPACKQLSLILLGILLISFTVTWYRVWWDTLVGIFVMVYGYWALRDTNPINLNPVRARRFHYGTILSLISHIIAVSEVTYAVIKLYVLDTLVHEHIGPGIPLFVFLYLFLLLEIGVTSLAVEKTYNLCQEISRNEYFLHTDARV